MVAISDTPENRAVFAANEVLRGNIILAEQIVKAVLSHLQSGWRPIETAPDEPFVVVDPSCRQVRMLDKDGYIVKWMSLLPPPAEENK